MIEVPHLNIMESWSSVTVLHRIYVSISRNSLRAHIEIILTIKVTFNNQSFRENIFDFSKIVINLYLAIVNLWGFGRIKIFIYLDFQIRPPSIRFENPHLSGFVHLTLFFSSIFINTHQYQCEIFNYINF